MGNTFEVQVWARDQNLGENRYTQFWAGQNFLSAIWNMAKAKRAGYGCVTLHWR
jgi:hypothetical protein